MMVHSQKPILLTGTHRSGTTWVGKVIAAADHVGYITEPFNDANRRPGIFAQQFGRYFPYLNKNEQQDFLQAFQDTLAFRYRFTAGIHGATTPRQYGRVGRDSVRSAYYRLMHFRPFIKDPNALFLAEWLYQQFDMNVMVIIRHPAAFISSLIKLNWRFPFEDYLKQPQLISDHLYDFEDEIISYASSEHSLIDQAILAWKTLHHVILTYQQRHPEWLFVKHEELSSDPLKGFENIYAQLGLQFDSRVQSMIQELSCSINPSDMTSRDIPVSSTRSITRDSRSNISNWKRRLSAEDISYIRERVEPISSIFYSDDEW